METVPAPLKRKVAIITGGSRGIGAATARLFAEQGCTHIAITYHTKKDKAEEVLSSIREINPKVKTCAIVADVFDTGIGPKVISEALSGLETDHIDILVSNASAIDPKGFPTVAEITKDRWDAMINANAWASLSLAKEAINHMPRGGRIIMISSGASKIAQGDPLIAYAASRAAMDAVSRNLGAAWGVQYGVTVNSISVGTTDTDTIKDAVKLLGPHVEEKAKSFSLLKRLGQAEEVAQIIAFVASPQAGWIVGNQIPANGGGLAMLQS